MQSEECTPSLSQAQRMKKLSQDGRLNVDVIFSILTEEKPNQNERGYFFMPFFEGGCFYHFTEGHLREYECMMQENDRRHIITMRERECKHCPHFDKSCNKYSKEKCGIFDD